MQQAYAPGHDMAVSLEAAFFRRVYNWMVAGLALTGVMAWFVASSQSLNQLILGNPIVFYLLIGAELVMVFTLASRVHKMKASTASTLFIIYSLLNGATLSFIFLAYTQSTIYTAFFVTAGTFAAMSVYGYATKRSLASLGGFLFMGLIGIIIASVVNMFLNSQTIYWVVTYAGVLIFVGLTAYDTQRLKEMARGGFEGEEMETKAAVMGALALYLDFINLFLMLLRIFGGSRD
ncbi:MAG: Bax inhibitor-1/YccA family protein [Proteobacteria bacterium]|nr:Bax inhibitor-1/YccA family protein [Pseudomonadota bacterium]